ncbi:tyrosine-protein phosphatase [Bacillus sp. NPDC077027]|uniref:tyrosine-protein phosphatase n=1 Tax=Bacillus sp. NPDC077027 TaxID=3390548 RepID=UPI003D081F46
MNRQHIHFSKLANFREVGGLNTEEGKLLKPGMIFRSANLSRLTKDDIHTFSQLGIQLICDLRTASERKSHPSKMQHDDKVKLMHISMQPDSKIPSKFSMFRMLTTQAKSLSFIPIMKDMYASMVNERHKEIQQFFNLLSDERHYPVLIHCTSGKDRTGFLSALVQLLVGVPKNKVLSQYMLSNDGVKILIKQQERLIRMMSLYRVSKLQTKPLLEVQQDYLEDALNQIIDTYGTVEQFLIEACHIPKEQIEKIKDILLKP